MKKYEKKDTKGSTQKVKECIYLNVLQHKSTNFFSKKNRGEILLVCKPHLFLTLCVYALTLLAQMYKKWG